MIRIGCVAAALSTLALHAHGFEEHPDHTTCEGAELAINTHDDLANWPRDKPLRCLWTNGRIASPILNGKRDMEHVSCSIADFLAELHYPEELRALKIYAQDLWAPCFEKHLNDHNRFFFPKLQILHFNSKEMHAHGDWFNMSQKFASIRNLREWVVSNNRLWVKDFRALPIMHHLEKWGMDAEDIEAEPQVYFQIMLEKAPNILSVHMGGHMRPPNHPHMNLAAKKAHERCPSDACAGLTTLSLNTPRFIFTTEKHDELRDLLHMLPSLRTLRLGQGCSMGWMEFRQAARELVGVAHPLPHLGFHFLDPSCNAARLRDKCWEGALEFVEAFPDVSEVQSNALSTGLNFSEFVEGLDDSIKHTYAHKDGVYQFGGGPPDLHPPIEETLDDVITEIGMPTVDSQSYIVQEKQAHREPKKTGGKISMNMYPPPKKIKPLVPEKDYSKTPWRHPKHSGGRVRQVKHDTFEIDTHPEL